MKHLFSLLLCVLSIFAFQLNAQDLEEFKADIVKFESEKDSLNLSRTYYKLGKFYYNEGQIEESIESLKTGLRLITYIENLKGIASISNYLASNFGELGNSDSAIFYYTIAMNASLENADSTQLPKVMINLGDEYASMGNYVKAAEYCILAVNIKEASKDSSELAYYYHKIGEVYKVAGEQEKWEEYINKAYPLIGDDYYTNIKATSAIYNDLGGIAEKHGRYNQALLYYDTLVSIGIENDFSNAIGVANSNRATIYKLQGNTKKALEATLEAQKYKRGGAYQQIYDFNQMAELQLLNGSPSEALKSVQQAVNHKAINFYPDEKTRAFQVLYQIEKTLGNYKNALEWNEKHKALSDSLRNEEIRTRIVDLEIGYQTAKKENQIKLLMTENELKNQRLRAGIVLLSVLVVLIVLILYILQIRKRQARFKQNELQQQVLRSQMNPHFMFNVLGSIQNYMMTNDTRKASNYLSQFASLTRKTLEYSTEETIKLADELEMLRNYIELEQMRAKGKFSYQIVIDEDMETDFILIPPMLVQPFVENAIKHAFKQIKTKGKLQLCITDKGDSVEFVVEDNGTGIVGASKQPLEHKSMAMAIFEKRRKLIQQKHKKEFKFELANLNESNPNQTGTRITINIPILEND